MILSLKGDFLNCMKNNCVYMKKNLFLLLRFVICSTLFGCVMNLCSCADDDSDYYNTSTIRLKAFVEKDRVFPFYCDSAVVTISSSDMTTYYKNITFSGDSVDEYISGIPCGNNREITVTVFDPTRTRWCTGKDTVYVSCSVTGISRIKLKQVQPNIISNDTIPGHKLAADEIWRGECLLKGDILIPSDIQLTIEPGSTIRITSGQLDWDSVHLAKNQVEIHCNGSLLANGSAGNIISLIPESLSTDKFIWWGIGCSGKHVSITHCHISNAEYGIFIFSLGDIPYIKNCLISYSSTGIVDFGPDNSFYNLSFHNVRYSFMIHKNNKTIDISLCDFNSLYIDIFGTDSNQNIMVRNSNFFSDKPNLTIADGTMITAINCYHLDGVDGNTTGIINIINQSAGPHPDAGCGFPVPFSKSTQPIKKKISEDPQTQAKINEKIDREVFKKKQIYTQ
jgi:hypothetical protein